MKTIQHATKRIFNVSSGEDCIGEKLSDLSESHQQEIAQALINRMPTYCMNSEVEYMLAKSYEDDESPLSHDDIENNTPTGQVGISSLVGGPSTWWTLTEDERDEKLAHYEYLRDKAEAILDTAAVKLGEMEGDDEPAYCDRVDKFQESHGRLDSIVDELACMDFDEYPEVYQWFLCPDLCYWLKKKGEVVLNNEYWGRTCCGQSIILDSVIKEIAFELEGEPLEELVNEVA